MNTEIGSNRGKWLTLFAVTLAFSYTFLCRFIFSPLIPDISAEFSLNATQAGLYMSAFFAGYLITQVPGGIMADKLQPKYILIICTLLNGVTTAIMSTIQSYDMGFIYRIMTGISSGCIMSSCSKIVASSFEPKDRTSAMGILLASPPIGITLANLIGPSMNHALGWRNTFTAVGFLSLVVVGAIRLFVKVTPKLTVSAAGKPKMLEGLKVYFSDKDQLVAGISGFLFMFVNVGFATWANSYANTLGFTKAQGGLIISCYSVAGIVGSSISGSLAKKLNLSHKSFLILTLSAMAILSLLFSLQRSYMMLLIVGIVYGIVSYLPSTHYTSIAMIKAGDQYSATAISTQNLIFQTSSMIQPAIIGKVIDVSGNYSLIWYAFVVCLVIAVIFTTIISGEPQHLVAKKQVTNKSN